MIRKVLCVLLTLFFFEDSSTIYGLNSVAPFGWLHEIFFAVPPYKIRFLDHVFAVCLFIALNGPDGKGPRVAPMKKALLIAVWTIVIGFAVGIARGGDFRWGSWQIYTLLSMLLFVFCIAANFRTPQHYMMLLKAMLVACAYRAAMCWFFYFTWIRNGRLDPPPEYITAHDDTVIWVIAILVCLVRFLETKKLGEKVGAFLFMIFIVGAVQFNARRLAWVSLVMGLLVVFALLRPGSRPRRKLTRFAMGAVPVLAIYCAVGWNSSARIFAPLQTFSSVTTTEDASTKSRNIENLGLIATANTNWLFGVGWGHKYIEISNKYTVEDSFKLWPYIPHNSVLGLLAYSGAVGFFGYWLPMPVAMFFNARMAKVAASPLAANIAAILGATIIICANQFFGDMGMFSYRTMYVIGVAYAFALRTPIMVGAWPGGAAARRGSRPIARGAAAERGGTRRAAPGRVAPAAARERSWGS